MYKYKLKDSEERYITFLTGHNVEFEFLTVKKGIATIKKGYSWDGATPKVKLFGVIIGVPDGKKDQLRYATLWHDVLTQYGTGKKKNVDLLFKKDMINVGWSLYSLYYTAVRLFGWLRWNRG